jgi:hypothetical protein
MTIAASIATASSINDAGMSLRKPTATFARAARPPAKLWELRAAASLARL